MFNKIWMWVIFAPIFPLWKNPNSENKKNHPTIPGNKKNLQASSLGQTKKCPWWNVQESHLSPQRPQPATDPREPGGARLRSNAKWQERGCICKITSLVFIELGWQHYPVGDFRSHAVPCWYSEPWNSSGLMNSFESVIKGDYTLAWRSTTFSLELFCPSLGNYCP